MFAELIAAEKHLGPEEPITQTRQIEVEPGVTVEETSTRGSRREGFERLSDVVTQHRKAWAQKHLDDYLRIRAEGDVREAARAYYRKAAERGGKPPTPKQFARVAVRPTNRWFGGDVSALYRAFGERSPVSPERVRVLPEDTKSFVRRVYWALGSVEVGQRPLRLHDQQEVEEHYHKRGENFKKNFNKEVLAEMALGYLQLEEALGRAPTLKEFGKDRFAYRAEAASLGADVEKAWADYENIVHNALMPEQTKPTEKNLMRDVENREYARPGAGEYHATPRNDRHRLPDDKPEQKQISHEVSSVSSSEGKAGSHVAAKSPGGAASSAADAEGWSV